MSVLGGASPRETGYVSVIRGVTVAIQDMVMGPLSSSQPRNQASPKYTEHRCLVLEVMMGCVWGRTQNFSAGTAPWILDWKGQQESQLRDRAWERFLKPDALSGA